MTVQIPTKNISPVNLEERQNLGIRAGDTVRVHQKIQEKGKTRLQVFEGLVIARKHGNEAGGTFTVRATHSGVGVERIFTLYSPLIDKIEIIRRSKVRRAKLYYIRDKVAREIRRQLRNMKLMDASTQSEAEVAKRAEEEQAAAEAAAKEAEEKAAKEAAEKESAEQAQAEEETKEDAAPAEEKADEPAPEAETEEEEKKEG